MDLTPFTGPFPFVTVLSSFGMWYVIALAYQEVTHSYGVESLDIKVSQVLILMGSSMIGSMVQLPGVGGGSQLATIATLYHLFDVPQELAASCGIMLWLVTFVAVVPVGLSSPAMSGSRSASCRKIAMSRPTPRTELPACRLSNC